MRGISALTAVVPAAVVSAALVFAAVLAGCAAAGSPGPRAASPAASASPAPAGVVTPALAQRVFTGFVAAGNASQDLRDSELATYEGGSSYRIDAAQMRRSQAASPGAAPDQYEYLHQQFLIPPQTRYPAWFAVSAVQQRLPPIAGGGTPQRYFVFTRASARAPWLEVRGPGARSFPAAQIPAAGSPDGYATQVSPGDATGLAIAPGRLAARDAAYLNKGTASRAARFANAKDALADVSDAAFWRRTLPAGSAVTDTHRAAGDPVYAVRTDDGGVLAFYDLTATLTLRAPAGRTLAVRVPGFADGSRLASAVTFGYLEQFAVYEPQGGYQSPQVLAEDSAMVSADCGGSACT